ncbi:MAG: NAD(P)-dependent dehydrogenase (short-subunit alcohol dehydrogenase family) [Hyphomicrobiaceae bacterium]|jgi:NAD(P)-dependent dehydrogenase (short-subunit alcohol dehydrogenase family)
MDVSGKKALVIGGTSGIGLATSKRLAALGAEVIAISRNPDKAADALEGVTLMQCDVLDRDALDTLFKSCGPFDILVSAATGGSRARGAFLDMDIEGYKASFAKLWGYANVLQLGTPHLSADGTIVLVSGTPARKPNPGQVAIGSVGAAVEALARAVAQEIAPRRLNVVAPGTIDTPMSALTGTEREEAYRRQTANNLIPRAGSADEVAQGILFVIQNDFVTGTTIDVDGGRLLA